MKKKKKIFAVCLSAVMLIAGFSVQSEAAPRISRKKATVQVGKTLTLKIRGARKIRWTSSDKRIASVSGKGVVRAKKKGTVTIMAKVGKKSYKCKVVVKKALSPKRTEKNAVKNDSEGETPAVVPTLTPPPNAVQVEGCGGDHVMRRTDEYEIEVCAEAGNSHLVYWIYQCEDCGYKEREKQGSRVSCTFGETRILRPASCEEDGCRNQTCIYCGREREQMNDYPSYMWEEMTVIPRTGHDFRYEYQNEITVSEDWDRWGGYQEAVNAAVEKLGERTAICKTCGKRYEEVGIDTGICLEDGTKAIAWGIWRKDKSNELRMRINHYRSSFEGSSREPLQESGYLNRIALYLTAARLQRHDMYSWEEEKTVKKEWNQQYVRSERGVKGTEYDVSTFPIDRIFHLQKEMKYAGVVYFELDLGDGTFVPGVTVMGNETERCSWKCSHLPTSSGEGCVKFVEGCTVGCQKCGDTWECGHSTEMEPDEKTGIAACGVCGYTVKYEWVVDDKAPYGEWRQPWLVCHHTDDADSTLRIEKNGVEAVCRVCQNLFRWTGDDSDEGGFWERF